MARELIKRAVQVDAIAQEGWWFNEAHHLIPGSDALGKEVVSDPTMSQIHIIVGAQIVMSARASLDPAWSLGNCRSWPRANLSRTP